MTISYRDIDRVLLPWAATHELHVYIDCKGEETRAMLFVDKVGDEYEIYAIPDYEAKSELIAVGCDLRKRGNKKHTFFRERAKFHFRKSIGLEDLRDTLDEAWSVIQQWGNTG